MTAANRRTRQVATKDFRWRCKDFPTRQKQLAEADQSPYLAAVPVAHRPAILEIKRDWASMRRTVSFKVSARKRFPELSAARLPFAEEIPVSVGVREIKLSQKCRPAIAQGSAFSVPGHELE